MLTNNVDRTIPIEPPSPESQPLLSRQDSKICCLSKAAFTEAATILTISSALIIGGSICAIYDKPLAAYMLIISGLGFLCLPCMASSSPTSSGRWPM